MGETYTILGNKRDTEVLNFKFIQGEDVTWKLK